MIGAGEPERGDPGHALPPGEGILQGVVECVADRQAAGDVRGRNVDDEGGSVAVTGLEVALLLPVVVPPALHLGMVVDLGKLGLCH